MSSDGQAVIRFVGVSIIQGQLALGVVVGKSDLIDILITDREAAELAIQIIRHLRDVTASSHAIANARRAGALEVLRRIDDEAVAPDARAWLAEMADEYGGWPEGKTAVSPSAIELADEITRARNAGALAALQAVKERGSEFSIWDIIYELADEYGGFADGEETA